MRRRLLSMWLGLALRAMERAAGYSAELLKDKTLDVLALSYKILYRAATGKPAPAFRGCLLYTSPSPRERTSSRMPSSA